MVCCSCCRAKPELKKAKRLPNLGAFFVRDHRKKHQVLRAKTAFLTTKQRFPKGKSAPYLATTTSHWQADWLQF
jgi:hypothetical protein